MFVQSSLVERKNLIHFPLEPIELSSFPRVETLINGDLIKIDTTVGATLDSHS